MSTVTLNMHEAKTRLSEVIAGLKPGDRVVLCRWNRPVAEIRPLPASSSEPRPVGPGDRGLPTHAREAIVDPSNEVFLSPISVWEIVIKQAMGRLVLKVPADSYVPEQRQLHRVDTLPITEHAALQRGRLLPHHRDPFDRLLLAQAVAEACTIATPDPLIRRYPVSTIW